MNLEERSLQLMHQIYSKEGKVVTGLAGAGTEIDSSEEPGRLPSVLHPFSRHWGLQEEQVSWLSLSVEPRRRKTHKSGWKVQLDGKNFGKSGGLPQLCSEIFIRLEFGTFKRLYSQELWMLIMEANQWSRKRCARCLVIVIIRDMPPITLAIP